jgi:hypothetical protein
MTLLWDKIYGKYLGELAMDSVYIQATVSLVTGGLAGAAVNAFITSRRQRLDITLSVIKDFFALYSDIGVVKGIFMAQDLDQTLRNPLNLNPLRRIGDWYNYVASLGKEGQVDVSLLSKVGVAKEMESFRDAITSAKARSPALDDVWAWWQNLKDFRA